MVVFNSMLIAGAILYCFGIHDPTSWMAFGGLLLTPPALYGILFLNTTLLRFCLQQFSCNFMFCNVVVLWFTFFMGFPKSAPVLVGFVGIFVCGILYCYQDATTPVFRGRWMAVASGTGLILLLLIVILHQAHIAQLQNSYFAFDGFEHDLRIRISSFAFNLATYQLRIVVNHWTNASHRLPSARCHMRSIILSTKDMIRLKTIVDALCKLETNTVDSSLNGGSMETVRVAYPVIKPYILLHADCVMSRFLSVRAYRFLYRRFLKPRVLFATELCLGAGMTLGVIAATQMRYRTLAIPGSILIAIFWYPLISMMNIRLVRSLLKSFEVLFVLFNLLMTFSWAIFGMHSWLNTLGWTCVLGGCILTLFSDTLPAKLVTSRTRVVIALESFLGLTFVTFLIVRGSSDTINDELRIPMIPDVHPLQYILGHMINSLIFAFKAVILGFFSRGSPWILRPEMVTSRMPLKFFELFKELMHFEPEDKFENSRSSMDSRTEKSRTHRSVSVLGLDEIPTDIPEEEESSVNHS
ncbi:Hypothetical Protein FCC1311_011312 [Hondaea fermentalgiana]|uniref:Uncharacterized protein n=1 Tax=Hondaea fermentalgiana TaxID=2315210 RepID=A0A2R5GB38_9STRA|nr:Hypothetical Protein FCC1311_011312 [Hondaea fermentalgiana]|eukprot:GBG24914.1 Hypothetical Protein FCC1311_011312 [Hondaea fermentalgiana]